MKTEKVFHMKVLSHMKVLLQKGHQHPMNRTKILQRSNQIWNKCSHLSAHIDEVHHLASDASSSVQYLKDCAAKLHSPCHGQIFFVNQTLGKDCCHNLVHDLGKPCNDNLTKHVLRSPQFKQNENQIL
ncbi:hypothetical protein VNO77_43280 [Canavalia gladiata]|uniref:Prolamin-like domain-containing protein n=1 Tax=Canavalia gladiata TaxID=3824 RepID=A0AAN9PMS3_CANGL